MSKKESVLHGMTVVGERGQMVIPQNIRAELGISPEEALRRTETDLLPLVAARVRSDGREMGGPPSPPSDTAPQRS